MKYKIGEKIKKVREDRGLTQNDLAEKIGVSAAAIGNWEQGTSRPNADMLVKLCRILTVSADILLETGLGDDENGHETVEIAKKILALDERGRHVVDAVIGAYSEAPAAPVVQMKDILLLSNSFAAGPSDPGSQLDQMERYSVPVDSRADFAIRISGDSMEPWLPDGSVALCRAEMPALGQIAAVMLDGEFLCKQFVHDNFGNVYLFSLNRKRCELDASVMASGDRDLKIFGTVMVNDRLPAIPVRLGEP